jgi:Zn-dependent membrane protease YugP
MMPILDPIALVLTLVLALGAGAVHMYLRSTYAKFSQIPVYSNLTGAQIARRIMASEGINDVAIEMVAGEMSDHYDPIHKVVRLSPAVHDGTSIASLGIAAHEVGHVIQHARGYAPLALRTYIAPVCSIGSNIAPFIILMGLLLSLPGLATLGLWLFAAFVGFTLITLPVEFNASKRAMLALADGRVMTADELYGARKVLNAAALTYVAAAVTAISWLLYYVFIVMGAQNRD